MALVLYRIYPRFFAEDLKFINYLGDSTGVRDATADVMNFNDVNRGNPRFWRTGCRIRVSGRKAHRLALELFSEARRREDAADTEQ